MRKIIFGGAFDPVHNGHINMALNARKALEGEVFFVPARISVWKESSAPVKDKIAMLKLAIKDLDGLFIDEFEINSGKDTNYSIDTVKHFKEKYPDDEIYYLIGVDQVNEFHRWKAADELASLAHIVFYDRPGHELKNENINRFHMQRIEGSLVDVSSSEIRELLKYDVPAEVLFYVVENNLYSGMNKISMMLTPHRLNHSKSVAKLAYEIAKANNLDNPLDAYMAGLFHDIGKDLAIEKQKEIMKEHYPDYIDMPDFFYHQFVGAYLAEKLFKVKDREILSAIEFHTTGNENMGKIAKIIYASDKIEPTRGFDSSDLIEAMMKDVDKGFQTVLQANKDFLISQGKKVNNPLTCKCFEQYL